MKTPIDYSDMPHIDTWQSFDWLAFWIGVCVGVLVGILI